VDEERRKLLAQEANLVAKVLLMFLFLAGDESLLSEADLFCRLDLDSAFIPENLRAFARAVGLEAQDKYYIGALQYWLKYRLGIYPSGGAGICLTRGAVKAFGQLLSTSQDGGGRFQRVVHAQPNRCVLQAGFHDDVVLGQCLRLANVTAHPALEDNLGRAYASHGPLPCWEHLSHSEQQRSLEAHEKMGADHEHERSRHQMLFELMSDGSKFGKSQWYYQMHRYAVCEPAESLQLGPHHWLSPFAFSFHGYKDVRLQSHAYEVIYGGARCNWSFGYKLQVLQAEMEY